MKKRFGLLRLLRATTLRYTGFYLLIFAISVGLILGYIRYNTSVLLEQQTDDAIDAETRVLSEQYRQGGLRALLRAVETRSAVDDGSIYLFVNPIGRRLAGNLRAMPTQALNESGWIEFPYAVRTLEGFNRHRARAFVAEFDEGFRLIIGKNIEERRQFARIMRRTLFWSIILLFFLGAMGGFLVSRNFLKPIEAINKTRRAIVAGDLSERIKTRGTGDELDRLASGLNDMLDQIERLMTSMREVSSNVAHDLKTPLTRLRAQTEDALRANNMGAYEKALKANLKESEALLRTFDALVSIARTQAGEAANRFTEVDLSDVARDVFELYEPTLEEAGGELVFSADEPVKLTGDRQLLAQAVSNLIDNAIKYGADPETGDLHISLAVKREDGQAVICVADRGSGIPKADIERVKDRFVRLDTSRSAPGNGLGLSLVDAVMTLHGGQFELQDNAPGLRARLILPVS